MDIEFVKNKIKLCIVGSGDWGTQILNTAELFNRYDIIGVIDSSTSQEEKDRILKESDMIYIAVPAAAQLEYVNYCIDNDKYTICEAPFLTSQTERQEVFHKLRAKKPRLFYVNSAYYMDTDFARIMAKIMSSKSKYISITCCGPKYANDLQKAKKFYINQAMFLLIQIAFAQNIQKFDKFISESETSGHFVFKDSILHFGYEYSDFSKNIIKAHTSEGVQENILVYDQYDHTFPILKFTSDQFYKIVPQHLYSQKDNIAEIYQSMNTQSYLLACTSEYFSDNFVSHNFNDSKNIIFDDPLKLFFAGGF